MKVRVTYQTEFGADSTVIEFDKLSHFVKKFKTIRIELLKFGSLTDEEHVVMQHLVAAHSLFGQLDSQHPDETNEWRAKFHDLQRLIYMRSVRRDYPNEFKKS